jgi:hypothetical protein
MLIGLYIKYSLLLSDFNLNEIWFFTTDFRKIFMYQISYKFVHWEPSSSFRINGQTWRRQQSLFAALRTRVKTWFMPVVKTSQIIIISIACFKFWIQAWFQVGLEYCHLVTLSGGNKYFWIYFVFIDIKCPPPTLTEYMTCSLAQDLSGQSRKSVSTHKLSAYI